MYIGEALFIRGHLSDYLQHQIAGLRPFVEKLMTAQGADADNDALVASILERAIVEPLTISFDDVTKDVQSVKIRLNDYGRHIEIDGVRATRSYPFKGERELFQLRPNTWTSVIPHGTVSQSAVTIGIEARNEPEDIKRALQQQEQLLREYADWQRETIDQHNSSLRPKIEALVAARRKHLDEVARLRDML